MPIDLRHLFAKDQAETENTEKEKTEDPSEEQENPEEEKAETQTTDEDSEEKTEETSETDEKEKKGPKLALKDWEDELERRIKENAQKDTSHRKSEGEVKAAFWEDYFNSNWKKAVADKLKQIDLLKTDIEDMGFDPLINPLLAFFLRHYTQKLVLEDLVNAETFKALNNAVANDYLADSEFVQENAYNILYCRDLYKYPARDILEYLRLQKEILKPNAPAYNKQTRTNNIKIFLENGFTSVLDEGAKLNELSEIEEFLKKSGKTGSSSGSTDTSKDASDVNDDDDENSTSSASNSGGKKTELSREELELVVQKMDDAEALTALQYVGIRTGDKAVFAALAKVPKHETTADVMAATAGVAQTFKNVKFTKASITDLTKLLVDRLKD